MHAPSTSAPSARRCRSAAAPSKSGRCITPARALHCATFKSCCTELGQQQGAGGETGRPGPCECARMRGGAAAESWGSSGPSRAFRCTPSAAPAALSGPPDRQRRLAALSANGVAPPAPFARLCCPGARFALAVGAPRPPAVPPRQPAAAAAVCDATACRCRRRSVTAHRGLPCRLLFTVANHLHGGSRRHLCSLPQRRCSRSAPAAGGVALNSHGSRRRWLPSTARGSRKRP